MIDEVLSLSGTYGNAVECDVEVNCIGVTDQAIVRNDCNSSSLGFFHCCTSGGTILRADDDDFYAGSDQSLNIGFFFCRIALTEEDLNVITSGRQSVFEAGFVLHPAWFVFGGEHDTNG